MEKGKDYRYRLSLGDRKDEKKYYKDDKSWDDAEGVLRTVLTGMKAPFYEAQNEAAFYGPKIDIQVRNVAGREETAFTVQYDFVMPKRFDLLYTAEDGTQKQPVVIHRSSIGALERTMAFLIEKTAGAFPLWLSPVQAVIIPIAERHTEAARSTAAQLSAAGFRIQVDDRSEPMQAKIRHHTLQKVPYLGIIGDREAASGGISVRTRSGTDLGAMPLAAFNRRMDEEVQNKR
ncbi:hypothetical protein A2Z33_01040 [Candidatus Gottesmanbacteria bacterium RBG_16_52_11]|uniref:Uncharacterized protein n=1 Tax=Candidatus Gottesmanbacteria bacterium RBG_16_52_11 TaxID=1798374 RepID=A0A1F5YPK1_9BACT|nr:MAG: hypothetical protein A2Z33_01040 [Candidatus Gottesmanbacteria bacterium RBG_16_52_11]